ncbi:ictacalcin-like [Lampris incognitus]|uniref:ictacalcin-like n=1 Tax=Lampris incognitus TaxID=2546036 RepID=UPI0024B4A745|nr:ictacalcin-like [Lampris incognitus]
MSSIASKRLTFICDDEDLWVSASPTTEAGFHVPVGCWTRTVAPVGSAEAIMSSGILKAMELLASTFYKYSKDEGDKHTLTKSEMKKLLKEEKLLNFENAGDPEAVEQFMKALDTNQDNTVDFAEYVTMITALTILCDPKFGQ